MHRVAKEKKRKSKINTVVIYLTGYFLKNKKKENIKDLVPYAPLLSNSTACDSTSFPPMADNQNKIFFVDFLT